jgi:chemotaxis protein methyltransferase CheR
VTEWSHPAFEEIARVVGARTGLALSSGIPDAETRIRRAMTRAHVAGASQYLQRLESRSVPLDTLIDELTIGETYFFRDPQHFDFIRHEVCPDVLRRRGRAHAIRIWSAGCATGEEAYSLAIALDEAGVAGHVLATDLSPAALRAARRATYRPWALRGVDAGLVRRYFHRHGDAWTLDDRCRRHVTFARHNLARGRCPDEAAGIADLDLILCRNVLIYMNRESIRVVAQGMADSLAAGGWLIAGPSDPPLNDLAPLTAVIADGGVFYQRRESTGPAVRRLPDRAVKTGAGPPVASVEPAPASPQAGGSAGGSPARTSDGPASADPDQAQAAFDSGDYDRVIRLTCRLDDDASLALRVRAIAGRHGPGSAAAVLARAIERCPMSPSLHLLRARLLIDLARDDEAIDALRRVLYLDRSVAIASFLLAAVLRRQGRMDAARRAYRNARDLARARPAGEPLPLSDGELAGSVAALADAELSRLAGAPGERP